MTKWTHPPQFTKLQIIVYAFTFFIRQALMFDVFKDLTGLGLWTMRIKLLIFFFFFFKEAWKDIWELFISWKIHCITINNTMHIIQRPLVNAAGMHDYRLYVYSIKLFLQDKKRGKIRCRIPTLHFFKFIYCVKCKTHF